jgi:hypothetical protein
LTFWNAFLPFIYIVFGCVVSIRVFFSSFRIFVKKKRYFLFPDLLICFEAVMRTYGLP